MSKAKQQALSGSKEYWVDLFTGEPIFNLTFQRRRRRRKASIKEPVIALTPSELMIKVAAEAYRRSMQDNSMWAMVCIFRALRRAALSASGGPSAGCRLHTGAPLHIRTVQQQKQPVPRGYKPPIELALPLMMTQSMQSEAIRVYKTCKRYQYRPRRAVKLIYKALRQTALEEDENLDTGYYTRTPESA